VRTLVANLQVLAAAFLRDVLDRLKSLPRLDNFSAARSTAVVKDVFDTHL